MWKSGWANQPRRNSASEKCVAQVRPDAVRFAAGAVVGVVETPPQGFAADR